MQLKPRSQRSMSVDELIRYFNRKLAGIPGIQVFLQNPPPIQIGGRRTKSLYQFTLQSPDAALRSEEHTSELQSHSDLVCRRLLEKKKNLEAILVLQVLLGIR